MKIINSNVLKGIFLVVLSALGHPAINATFSKQTLQLLNNNYIANHVIIFSLLYFANGKPIKNNDDACWLAIHGANSYGEDKCSLDDRTQWVSDNEEMIFKCAESPHQNTEWSQADKPYQFLAFCF